MAAKAVLWDKARKRWDRMKIVYSDKHAQHDPQTFFVRGVKQRSAEQPERAERLLAAASRRVARSGCSVLRCLTPRTKKVCGSCAACLSE